MASGTRVKIDPRELAQLEADQDPVIFRRSFKNAAVGGRAKVVSSERTPFGEVVEFDPSKPFSVSCWVKCPKPEPEVIHREGTIRVASVDDDPTERVVRE